MGRQLDLNAMFQKASPKTRREILSLAAKGGIAAPVLMTMLARDGVKPVAAAPASQAGTPVKGGTFVVTGPPGGGHAEPRLPGRLDRVDLHHPNPQRPLGDG